MTVTLSDFTARELLRALRGSYVNSYDWEYPEDEKFLAGVRKIPGGESVAVYATAAEIRAALRSKEHVPSKAEGKMIRRLRAETGMTEEQLRAHPRFGTMIVNATRKRFELHKKRDAEAIARFQKHLGRRVFAMRYVVVG